MMGVSENLLNIVDDEVRRIVDECYAEARRALRENRHRLDSIVHELLARETLEEREIYTAAGIERPTNPKAAEPVAAQ
jgi:cell division protease FtsH